MNFKSLKEAFYLIKNGKFNRLKSKILIKFGNPETIFTEFYKTNVWGSNESISGIGSELKYTRSIIEKLPSLLIKYNIKTINDVPSGDFHYMKNIDLTEYQYFGYDIVSELIKKNIKLYGKHNIHFAKFDAIKSILPINDIIISRDMLIHFSFENGIATFENFKKSGSKYLLTNTYPDIKKNINIKTGSWRPLNLLLPPYNFSEPIDFIDEYSSEEHGLKQLALFKIN